jgi:hypothetical protein
MAYPTVSAPYGLRPVNRQDGMAYAGATTQYGITSVSTAIYNGDVVYINAGTISKSGVTDNATTTGNLTAGVFMGCQYVNTQGQTVQAQYYPGNAAASSAIAYVVVDPNAAYKVAVTASGSATITGTTVGAIGVNCSLRQGTGSSTTGDSGVSVVAPSAAAGNASTIPVKVIAVVPETATNATNFTEVLVVLTNPQMTRATGVDFA